MEPVPIHYRDQRLIKRGGISRTDITRCNILHGCLVNRPNISLQCCAHSVSSVKEGNLKAGVRNKQQNTDDRKLVNDKTIIAIDWFLNTGVHLNPIAASLRFVVE